MNLASFRSTLSHRGVIGAPLHDLIKIHASRALPEGTSLFVPYREHWFYVDDNDVDTKRTLGLLTSLIRLTISAGGGQNVPILTLPVGR